VFELGGHGGGGKGAGGTRPRGAERVSGAGGRGGGESAMWQGFSPGIRLWQGFSPGIRL